MILGLLLFLVANGAVLLGAHDLLRRVRTGEPSVDTVIFLLLRLLLISVAVIVAGVTTTLTRWGLGIAGVVALAGLLALGSHKRLPRFAFPEADRWMKIFAGVVAFRLLLQVWFFAPHLGDALAYHLPKIAEWVQNGHFTREMGLHPHVTFPAGFELIETWWVVFLHHDVLIEMAGVEFLVLAFAATYVLARRIGLASRWSFFAGLFYVMTPGLHLSATSCLNDTPVAALVVATFGLVAWRVPLGLVMIAVGLGAGVKATYIYALPGIILLWVLSRKETRLSSSASRLNTVLIIAAFAVGGFWYGRNLAWFGNPLYPVGSPGYTAEPVAVQTGPQISSFLANASDLVTTRIYDNQGAYGANVDNIAGWGAPGFACGLLALVIAFLDDSAARRITFGFLLSLASCFLLMIHDPWSLKYVFFFPAVLCIAVAYLGAAHRPVAGMAVAALAFSFVVTFLPYDLPFKHVQILASQPWHTRTGLLLSEPECANSRIACFGGFRVNAYHLYGPDFSREVFYLRPKGADELIVAMRMAELQVLYAVPVTFEQHNILDSCVKLGTLTSIGRRLYRLKKVE